MITISNVARADLIRFKAIMNSRVFFSKLERWKMENVKWKLFTCQFYFFYFEKKTLLAYGSREGFAFLSRAW